MNDLLIRKLFVTYNEKYPEVTFSNPLLDKTVTKTLARSLVKILTTCKGNSPVNSKIRPCILEHIRKLCVVQPDNHVQLDDAFTELLCTFYEDIVQEEIKRNSAIDKKLDRFLLKTHKELDLSSSVKLSFHAETIQSLINLNDHSTNRNILLNTIYNDILHWDTREQCSIILYNIWCNHENLDLNILNDVSLKMKPHIETVLLNLCIDLQNCNQKNSFNYRKQFNDISNVSLKSSSCFQTVCSILNYIFIATHFNKVIEMFIQDYVNYVKCNCTNNFALLYPNHLTSVIPLLDIDIVDLPSPLQKSYIDSTLQNLNNIGLESNTDLIMLLCHFPNWFDLYFNNK